jgi:hypothetical protein
MTGSGFVQASWLSTAVFVANSAAAVAVGGTVRVVAAGVDVALFIGGVGCFFWAYAVAVNRSRTDEIGIGGLFFLAGSAPPSVRRPLLTALVIQIVVAFATAAVRPFTSLAFGILVPVFGLGITGLWGARHGTFPARRAKDHA